VVVRVGAAPRSMTMPRPACRGIVLSGRADPADVTGQRPSYRFLSGCWQLLESLLATVSTTGRHVV